MRDITKNKHIFIPMEEFNSANVFFLITYATGQSLRFSPSSPAPRQESEELMRLVVEQHPEVREQQRQGVLLKIDPAVDLLAWVHHL